MLKIYLIVSNNLCIFTISIHKYIKFYIHILPINIVLNYIISQIFLNIYDCAVT